jgi:putative oxidoreductase
MIGTTAGAAPTRTEARTATGTDWGLLLLRLTLGIVFMAHGSQKLLGAFGGHGLSATMHMMGPVLGFLVSIGEFFGGLGILVGILSRFSAAAIAVIMLGAIVTVHMKNGFFMNWMGTQHGEGFEFHLLVIGMCLLLVLSGPGRLSATALLPWLDRHPKAA